MEPRILHINTAKTWRGGERQVFNLALEQAEAGLPIIIVGQPGSELETRCQEKNLPFRGVKTRGELDFFGPGKIAAIAAEFQANILHAHTSKAHTMALRVKKKLPGLKLIVARRVDFHVGENFLSRRKYLSPLVDRYLTVSEKIREILIEDGIKPGNVETVYSGIDPARYTDVPDPEYLRREFQIKPGEVTLGNVAALVDHKDQDSLLRAMARLPGPGATDSAGEEMPVYRLFILGEGELEAPLKKLAGELGLFDSGRVIFTGFRTDILPFYRLMDLFVMSSKEEGLGTAVLDAMAFGLPVAAAAGGGIPEMIDQEQGGLLSPIQDPAALAVSLERLIRDAGLRESMGVYNLKRVEDFSMKNVHRKTLDNYRRVLA